jgi:steroid delta-isomerase-like uncharacterized protein
MRIISRSAMVLLFGLLPACGARPRAPERAGEPRAVFEAFVGAWNRHDYAALDSIVGKGAVHEDMALGFRGRGVDEIKGFMKQTYGMIPDFDWRPTVILVDGPRAAAEWTLAGTYTGETPAGPVRDRHFSIRGASVVLIEGGRISRFTDYYELTEFYRQVASASTSASVR